MIVICVIATLILAIVGDVLMRDHPAIGRHTAEHFETQAAKAATEVATP